MSPEEEEAQRMYNPSPLDTPSTEAQLESPLASEPAPETTLVDKKGTETSLSAGLAQKAPEEDKITLGDVGGDLAMFGLRGAEGFVESVAGLFGSKWDRKDWSLFGKSKTMAGVFAENIVQFGIGMIPGLGTAGLIGKGAKVAKAA